MAGGEFAQTVPCMMCAARAERTSEGSENDYYRCEDGHSFGVDWSHGGPPTEPQWPPTREYLAERARYEDLLALHSAVAPPSGLTIDPAAEGLAATATEHVGGYRTLPMPSLPTPDEHRLRGPLTLLRSLHRWLRRRLAGPRR